MPLIDILVENPLLVAVSWMGLSLFDFTATMLYSKAYRDFLSMHITYEGGMEMNPVFEKDVNRLRWLSPRYFMVMPIAALLIAFVGGWMPTSTFEMLAGVALLVVLTVDLRHIENLFFVWFLRSDPGSINGKITQSYSLSQRRTAIWSLNFGILYLIIFFMTRRLFFVGGTLVCVLLAIRHFLLSRRKVSNLDA